MGIMGSVYHFSSGADYSYLRWTIDEQEIWACEKLFQEMNMTLVLLERCSVAALFKTCQPFKKSHDWNEGAKMTLGQKKWRRATQIVSVERGLIEAPNSPQINGRHIQ